MQWPAASNQYNHTKDTVTTANFTKTHKADRMALWSLTAMERAGTGGQEGLNFAGFARGSLPIHVPVDQR